MPIEQVRRCLNLIRPYTDYVYFHLMGEPLLYSELEDCLYAAKETGLKVILTTNGTLLSRRREILLRAEALHKVNISLHSYEGNDSQLPLEDYLTQCINFAKNSQAITCFRLWNIGGKDTLNSLIEEQLRLAFPESWAPKRQGIQLSEHIYLQYADLFAWPDSAAEDYGTERFCYGLRDHIGILCDGTVVPCCLDSDGTISLGNIFETPLEDILSSERAVRIYNGFSSHRAEEELCRRCGYSTRFL